MGDFKCYFCAEPAIYSVRGATDTVKRDVIYMCSKCHHAFSFGFALCTKPSLTTRVLQELVDG